MQKIPFATKFYKLFLPLYPFAFESFDFSGFDIVISSTTRFAKSIITTPNTFHICYTNSVPRFLYHEDSKENYLPSILNLLFKPFFWWLKRWDMVASSRPDLYIANSQNVQKSIQDQYNRESIVIHPFADTTFFQPAKHKKSGEYYLVVSRLVKWKRVDIAIAACRDLNQRLVIIGSGPDGIRLKSIAAKNKSLHTRRSIEFLPKVSRDQLRSFYQNAKALIVTQKEDFGIAMVEAQACGIPVICYYEGGSKEIVKEAESGILYKEQTPKSLKDAIYAHSRLKWEVSTIRENVLKFSKENFVKSIKGEVKLYADKRK